jgi:hypothetical protein
MNQTEANPSNNADAGRGLSEGLGITDLDDIQVLSFIESQAYPGDYKVWELTFAKRGLTISKRLYVGGLVLRMMQHTRIDELKYQLFKLCLEVKRDFYAAEHDCSHRQMLGMVKAKDARPLFERTAKSMPNMPENWYL